MTTRPTPVILALAIALASVISVHSAGLDDLLDDKGVSTSLAETDKFQATWDTLLGELSRREYAKADAALRTLEAEKGFVSPRRRDFIRLSGRVVRFKESLESDKAAFRDAFKNVGEGVAELEREAKALELHYNSMIRKGGMTVEIKKNMDKKWNDKQAEVAKRRKLLDSMKVEAQNFEGTRVEKLETEIAEWISKDDTEEDVVTGLVLSTAYLDQVGDSEKVRALSQKLSGKQSELEKAGKIVAAIVAEIEPLAAAGKGEEAQSRLDGMIAKVETSNQSEFVRSSAVKKLRALDIKVSSARTSESRNQAAASMNAAEISARLVELWTI